MFFNETETRNLSQWLERELEYICDADPKVLSEYILALLKHDSPASELMGVCIESLAEFLGAGETEPFVHKLFQALESKSFADQTQEAAAADGADQEMDIENLQEHGSSRRDRDDDRRDSRYDRDRDYRRDTDDRDRRYGRRTDDRDRYGDRPRRGRCFDFDGKPSGPLTGVEKGFCLRGDDCRYEHISRDRDHHSHRRDRSERSYDRSYDRRDADRRDDDRNYPSGRGGFSQRGRGSRGGRGGFARRIHSHGAQKVLVVENIPEESCNDTQVREYFSRFGELVNVSVNFPSKSALLEFSTSQEAKACHSSPEAIFNNRFVKVYWSEEEQIQNPQPPQPKLSEVELLANLQRMQEKKRELALAALEKQKQLAEIQKTRQAMIAARMEEQTATMNRLRDPSVSVDERAILMKQLELLQSTIKTLMADAQTAAGPQPTAPAYRPPSFRPAFRPSFRPPYKPHGPKHISERQYALPIAASDPTYAERFQKFQELEAQVAQQGNVDPVVLQEIARMKQEFAATGPKAQPVVAPGQKSMKLDNRPKSFFLPNSTIDLEDHLKTSMGSLKGFQGIEVSPDGQELLVKFASRGEAEAGLSRLPEGSFAQWTPQQQ
ncbi:hypothetical protein HDV03_000332 [Kappamyces sp. JEL0829]|nr:hypothetical protein HDV03_000332 [Kappamyces sp. JEL0829]